MTKAFNRKTEKKRRQYLRKNMPEAEVILWSKLRRKQLCNIKFRRQYSVGPYVLDFYAPQIKLAIELDGDSHFTTEAKNHDRERDEYIEGFGIKILRILNPEIYENLDNVLEYIGRVIGERTEVRDPKVDRNPPMSPLGRSCSF